MKKHKALKMAIEALQIQRADYAFDIRNCYVGEVNVHPRKRAELKVAKIDQAIIRLQKERQTRKGAR